MPDDLPALGPPPTGPPPKMGLFGKPKELPPPPMDTSGLQRDVNTLNTRILVSEERYTDLRRKLQLIESNMLANHKKAMTEIKIINSEISDIKRTVEAVENKIILLIKELQLSAKKEDIDLLKRYVELWEPAKFATFDYVDKAIKDALEKEPPEEE